MRRQIVTKLGSVDEWIANADLYPEEHTIYDDECLICAEGIRIIIPDVHLSVRDGTYYYKEDNGDQWTPDFSITLVYPENETDPAKWLYWEQDDAATTLHNYLYPNAPEDIYGLTAIIDINEEAIEE